MNTRPILDSDRGPFVLSASFNADCSHFSVALETGFRGRVGPHSSHRHKLTVVVFSSTTCEERIARGVFSPVAPTGTMLTYPQRSAAASAAQRCSAT